MITIQRRAYEKLITELIYARDLRRLVKKYSVDRAYYFSILKDISNGKRSPNYDVLAKIARKKDLSDDFIIEQARAVLNFYVPYDQGQSPDYYKLLNVRSDATDEEIRRSWIELMKANHPDRAGYDGLDRSKKINEAYEILRDTAKRDRYDRMHLPFIPVSVERRASYQNFYYAIPFVVIAAFAFLYVAGSGLLFKSQEDKEKLARVIENPNLPNAIYRGDRLTVNEEVVDENELEERVEEIAAEHKSVKLADEAGPPGKTARDNTDTKSRAKAKSGSGQIRKVETEVAEQENSVKKSESKKVASLYESDIDEELKQANNRTEGKKTESGMKEGEDKEGMVIAGEATEEKPGAAEPDVEEKVNAEGIAAVPVDNKPKPEEAISVKTDEAESPDVAQAEKSESKAGEERLASAEVRTEDKAGKTSKEPKPAVLKTTKYGEVYTVKPGDSLWTIARRFDTHIVDIQRLNGMTSNQIKPGDDIIVSGKGLPAAQVASRPKTKPEEKSKEIARVNADVKVTPVKEAPPKAEPKRYDSGISTTAVAAEKRNVVKPVAPQAPSPDKNSLYGFVADYVSAYKSRDVGRVKSLFAPDGVENGKSISTVIPAYSSSFDTLEIISYDIKVRNAAVYKNTGTVGGDFYVSFRDQRTGARKTSQGRIDWKLYWDSGKWKIKELSYKVEKSD